MTLEPGALVTPKLRLDRKIAEGGMGVVWLAEHLALERKVALKFLSPALRGQGEAEARFEREARVIARLKSPYVPEIFDVGRTSDGTPFIALEPLTGEDLHARLVFQRRLSMADTVTVVTHVASALGEVHAHGIVHRDVKPENIFLVPDDDDGFLAKLLDFGIAKPRLPSHDRLTQRDGFVGTPAYMSPEQLTGEGEVDARADLWSLGVVAYECITGLLPFDGQTVAAACAAVVYGQFVPPSAVRGVPFAVDAFFARAFQKAPDRRFQSAAEMSRVFRMAVEGDPAFLLRRRAASRPSAVAAARGRSPVVAWVALGLLGAGSTLALARSRVPDERAAPETSRHADVVRDPLPPPPPIPTCPSAGASSAPPVARSVPPIPSRHRHPRPLASFDEGVVVDDQVFNATPATSSSSPSNDEPPASEVDGEEDNPY